MVKLKSKFILATMVVFGVLASITSCNKNELSESTKTNPESIVDTYTNFANQSVEQYITNNNKLSWIDWIAIGVADATGACEGAKLAAPLVPPWGSIGGGLIVGAAASYTTYRALGGTPPATAPTTVSGNPNNAYENAGICHNLALWKCVTTNMPSDLDVIYNDIAADISNITFGNLTTNDLFMILPIGVYHSAFTLMNPYPIGMFQEPDFHAYLMNFTNPIIADILANYFHNMFLIGDLQGCTAYSIDMEDFITMSTMDPNDKKLILIAMSVFRNSINFWN